MVTGEREQRAAAVMVREVDRKRFCLELRGCCGEPSSTQRGRTRPLNRILEAAKIRREPKRALNEQNQMGLFLERVGMLEGVMCALKLGACRVGGLVPPRER
jgi:hypothetical protein